VSRPLNCLLLVATVGAGAELGARVDDWLRWGIPLGSVPDQVYSLRMHDTFGVRGRPAGRYHTWQLDTFGFRGPEITRQPVAGCTRIIVLGSSEAFGYFETPGMEFPAQLRERLAGKPCREVVNAAIAGATVHSMITLWTHWVSNFGGRFVIVYANPAFYLSTTMPGSTPRSKGDPSPAVVDHAPPWWTPRLVDRAHRAFHYPAAIQRQRVKRLLVDELAGHDSAWVFHGVPADRLAQYAHDLDSLTVSIRESGATPVLVTHAVPFHTPPLAGDSDLLREWRTYAPRATPATLLAFNDSSAAVTRRLAAARGTLLVDAASALDGHAAYFADFTHFTDLGAGALADLLAAALRAADP
jgi:hypothetical protein